MSEQIEQQPADIPDNVVVASNGVWRDKTTGVFVKGGKPTNAITTPEQASALATARWDAYRERAQLGAAKGAMVNSSLDAWEWIVARQTQLAGNIEQGRSSTEAANFVERALQARPERTSQAGGGGPAMQINVSEAGLQRLIALIEGRMTPEQGDSATVIDVDSE